MCKIKQMYTVVKYKKISLNKCSSLNEAQAAGLTIGIHCLRYSAFWRGMKLFELSRGTNLKVTTV